MLVQDELGNWYDDGTSAIDWSGYGGITYNPSTAADNIDMGGGWNPATGTGDQATADAAAATGATDTSGYNTGTWNPSAPSGLSSLLKQLGSVVKTNGAYDLAKLASLGAGLYAATKSNSNTQPAGYQGGIPNLVATRQAPGPDGKLSGNVTYTRKAAGGLLESGGFVIPADVVSHLGNGNSEAGAKRLYAMMDKIRTARTGTKKQGKQINPDKFLA